jgi:hypothetical protein
MSTVLKWVLAGLGALLLGVWAGAWYALLRRRPVPEVTSYVAPQPAPGPTAMGPHRAVIKVVDE